MLLALMYHRVGAGKYANSPEMLREHLEFLKSRYPLVLPGDPLPKRKTSICLTFDDATYDFYHYAYPILKELNIRALLGVPTGYIIEKSEISSEERLNVPYTLAMQDDFFKEKIPFCTWEELEEMVRSGHVEVASHAYMHCNLTFDFVNLEREVVQSKEMIEKRLPQAISSFIYPFGKVNRKIQDYVSKHYAYSFRIGSALNFGWGNGEKPLSRVVGDQMSSSTNLLRPINFLKYFWKTLS